jgi:dipeptidyl aminopeptidase/acylaminoacyl peptidase
MGYAVVNLNYRLVTSSGTVKLADQINDIREAVNFAYSKSVDWEVSNKIGLVGASAGAHLALLYTYAYNADDKVKTVVSLAGPVNFNDARNVSPQLASVVEGLVGAKLSSNPQAFAALSPIAKVTPSSKPTLIFHGRKDTTVPIQQSIDLKAKLDEANVKNKLVIYENAGHEVVSTDNMASFMGDLSSWLNANMK